MRVINRRKGKWYGHILTGNGLLMGKIISEDMLMKLRRREHYCVLETGTGLVIFRGRKTNNFGVSGNSLRERRNAKEETDAPG